MSPDAAEAAIEELCRLIEEDVPDEAKEKAPEFFEDVTSSATSMSETIAKTGRVTPRQEQAIKNWTRSVKNWIHDD